MRNWLFFCVFMFNILVYAQPIKGNIYINVYGVNKALVRFERGECEYKFYSVWHLADGREELIQKYSGCAYKDTIGVCGVISLIRPTSEFMIIYKVDTMRVKIINESEDWSSSSNLVIDSLNFLQGDFQIDCKKSSNQEINHELFYWCYDITPYYWWFKQDE